MAAPPIRIYTTESPTRRPSRRSLLSASYQPVPWRCIFGNDHPVQVEVGCGSGRFLVAAAREHPQHNFIGLERVVRLAERADRQTSALDLWNARVLRCDARCVVAHLIPDASVTTYHIYFPDPWWKRRHHKRRLDSRSFTAAVTRTLVPGGRVLLATDVPEVLNAFAARFIAHGLERTPLTVADLPTPFARRCLQAERPIRAAAFVRHPDAANVRQLGVGSDPKPPG